jgi:hypothetical protein
VLIRERVDYWRGSLIDEGVIGEGCTCLLEKRAYWRRELIEEEGLLEREAYWKGMLIDEGVIGEGCICLIIEISKLERGVYWSGKVWRGVLIGEGSLVERGACWTGGLLESGKYWRRKGFFGEGIY